MGRIDAVETHYWKEFDDDETLTRLINDREFRTYKTLSLIEGSMGDFINQTEFKTTFYNKFTWEKTPSVKKLCQILFNHLKVSEIPDLMIQLDSILASQ